MINYGSQQHHTEMSYEDCSHQLGEGQSANAAMSPVFRPSQPVYGSLCYHAAMPIYDRSHLFTRGLHKNAAMLKGTRLSREGSDYARRNANAGLPFPTSFGPYDNRRNVTQQSPNITRGHHSNAAMLVKCRLAREGSSSYHSSATWTAPFPISLREPIELRRNANLNYLPPILTRGQSRYAAMPRSDRLSREGSVNKHRNVRRSTPFSTSYRGSVLDRRNAKNDSPPPVLGHLNHAAMLISKRPINFNQRPSQ